MEVLIEGHRELIKSLRAVDRDLPKRLGGIHKEIGEPIARAAASRAPRISGRMGDSIRALGSQRAATIAAGKKSVPYAGPIHWGWPARNIEPQPFLADALEDNSERAANDYYRLIDRFLDEVWQTL